jgi:hypothetical protein
MKRTHRVLLLVVSSVAMLAWAGDDHGGESTNKKGAKAAAAFKNLKPGQMKFRSPTGCEKSCNDEFDACSSKCGPIEEDPPKDAKKAKDEEKKRPVDEPPSKADQCAAQCAKALKPCMDRCS